MVRLQADVAGRPGRGGRARRPCRAGSRDGPMSRPGDEGRPGSRQPARHAAPACPGQPFVGALVTAARPPPRRPWSAGCADAVGELWYRAAPGRAAVARGNLAQVGARGWRRRTAAAPGPGRPPPIPVALERLVRAAFRHARAHLRGDHAGRGQRPATLAQHLVDRARPSASMPPSRRPAPSSSPRSTSGPWWRCRRCSRRPPTASRSRRRWRPSTTPSCSASCDGPASSAERASSACATRAASCVRRSRAARAWGMVADRDITGRRHPDHAVRPARPRCRSDLPSSPSSRGRRSTWPPSRRIRGRPVPGLARDARRTRRPTSRAGPGRGAPRGRGAARSRTSWPPAPGAVVERSSTRSGRRSARGPRAARVAPPGRSRRMSPPLLRSDARPRPRRRRTGAPTSTSTRWPPTA